MKTKELIKKIEQKTGKREKDGIIREALQLYLNDLSASHPRQQLANMDFEERILKLGL